ncbi:TetR/AcrR family transcriptional regulator [Aromatoleum toluclasticum]|uniref:TetR/AcrR family transcriptional regulator n=1 Tax=Aromatoleum toluclasticum TaxID=92003 RepID=UPI001D18E429|nr:TetR/AcrR family transcriptional regulator [Aromatoleum toluclasticum]MCC4117595.1 TetR/AcrR family transcriptional regulator [Aromatoleum toluclasticum]
MSKVAGRGVAHAISEGKKQRAVPSQARARFTVETILEAASEILRVEGVDAVTTRKIAARAGVSVGAVYQYFPDKEAILIEISKRIMDEESEAASPELFRLHRKSLDEMLQALFRNTVRTETRLYSLGRDYYRRYARQMQFGRAQGLGRGPRTSEQLVGNMEMLLKQHADVVGEPDTQLASFMLVRGMRIILATLVEERPELLQSPSLVPMLVRIARAINDSREGGEEGAG